MLVQVPWHTNHLAHLVASSPAAFGREWSLVQALASSLKRKEPGLALHEAELALLRGERHRWQVVAAVAHVLSLHAHRDCALWSLCLLLHWRVQLELVQCAETPRYDDLAPRQ